MSVTTLSAERILTHPGHREALRSASVEIAGGKVSAVKTSASVSDRMLMMPALTDAHDHGRGQRSFAVGAADEALELWLPMLALEPLVDPYLRAAVAFGRLARSGVAVINHCHNPQRPRNMADEAAAVARAAKDVGVRVAFGVPMRDRNYFAYGDPALLETALGKEDFTQLSAQVYQPSIDEQFGTFAAIAAHEHPLFEVQFSPVAPQWCSDKLLARIAEESAHTGRRIHMHLLETLQQRQWADANYPQGIVTHLDSLGLLSGRLTVAHGVWLKPQECEILAERGVTVSVNTSSNLRLKSGMAPVDIFAAKGLSWAMGLDGMSLDDDEDALRELRTLWYNHKSGNIGGGVTRTDCCKAAFEAGRRTVTKVTGGAIEPGMAADLLILDYGAMSHDVYEGAADEVDVVLARARKEYVRHLMIDGRMVVRDGRLATVDLDALEGELLEQGRRGLAEAQARKPLRLRYRQALADFYRCGCHASVSN